MTSIEIADTAAAAGASATAAAANKKAFVLPFFWAWAAPAINLTAAWLITSKTALGVSWLPFIVGCGFGVRLMLAPFMFRQMVLINKMSHASPYFRLAFMLFSKSKLPLHQRVYHTGRAVFNYARQTEVSLGKFYFYNLIQLPVFVTMIMSFRKLAFEQEDMAGAGMLWFPNLNEADPYMILPIMATLLNYFNLGRGITKENEHWFFNRFRSFF
jgi:membrane protein insertase Oxa1/YidC/SpoIIIJ